MGMRIGIDLGEEYSVMAVVKPDGCKVLQNKEYEQSTRSIVSYYEDEFLVGRPALQ
jgi:molecular chaperone DnaK (HSP70)